MKYQLNPADPGFARVLVRTVEQFIASTLREPLAIVMPGKQRLRKRDGTWQRELQSKMAATDEAPRNATVIRENAQDDLGRALSIYHSATLPDGLLQATAYAEVQDALGDFSGPGENDRRSELKRSVAQKAQALIAAQHSRGWKRGWFLLPAVILAAASVALGVFTYLGVFERLREVVALCAAGGFAAVFIAIFGGLQRRNRAIDAASAELLAVYNQYVENVVSLSAKPEARASVAWLRDEAGSRSKAQHSKANFIERHLAVADVVRAQQNAVQSLPVYNGEVAGRGPAVHSVVQGTSLLMVYAEVVGSQASDLFDDLGRFLRDGDLVPQWESWSPEEAANQIRRWLRAFARERGEQWSLADILALDADASRRWIGTLASAAAPATLLNPDDPVVQDAINRTDIFVEYDGDPRTLLVVESAIADARPCAGAGANEMRVVRVGPKLLTARELLQGAPTVRYALEHQREVELNMPSPVVAELVENLRIFDRVKGDALSDAWTTQEERLLNLGDIARAVPDVSRESVTEVGDTNPTREIVPTTLRRDGAF